jgi:hypothetical protein
MLFSERYKNVCYSKLTFTRRSRKKTI